MTLRALARVWRETKYPVAVLLNPPKRAGASSQGTPRCPGPAAPTFCALLVSLLTLPVQADDWSQYRGPQRDGRSAETGLLRSWPADGPQVLWRAPLGVGYSSPAVAGGRVFTQDAAEGREFTVAFDAAGGKELWRRATGRMRADAEGGGPRATPTVEGGVVYSLGAMAVLTALDAASGEVRWSVDLRQELGARVPRWGVAGSPVVEGGRVLLQAGGGRGRSFVALDKATGAVQWTSGGDLPGYAAPIVVTLADVRQAVFFTADAVVGVAVADGERLWSAPWRTSFDVNAAIPIFVPASGIFVSSGYDTGAALLQVVKESDGFEPYQIWRSRVLRSHYNAAVLDGQYLYGFDESILKCVDVLSGREAWRGRAGTKGSLIWADGHLLVLAGDGFLSLVEATPDGFLSLAEARLLRDRTWAAPALADGVLYVRGWGELVAARVGQPPAAASAAR